MGRGKSREGEEREGGAGKGRSGEPMDCIAGTRYQLDGRYQLGRCGISLTSLYQEHVIITYRIERMLVTIHSRLLSDAYLRKDAT